jgi:hypothetical protein
LSSLDEIARSEDLGRGVFSEKDANRAERSGPRLNLFLTRLGDIEISVDRLCLDLETVFVTLGEDRAKSRRKKFYGWAVITASEAASNGRRVKATPVDDINPYHADIVLPYSATRDRAIQKLHAKELADRAVWRPRTA